MRFRDTTGMMRWNRENRIPRGLRGVTKAILRHNQTMDTAAAILAEEHGTRHQPGEHNLCPKCIELRSHNAELSHDAGKADLPQNNL